jgi:predicted nucleic acid-binding protein
VERGDAEGCLSAHAVTTLHYLNAKAVGGKIACETSEALLSVFEVAAVDGPALHAALALRWTDFEDAVTAAAARRSKCDVVVTRNARHFKGSPVKALTPSETVAWLGVEP